ncbi:MAG: tRNA pseudouridine(55) synthase TruB [Planctomycetia bacterium]|nr:tRNA pseudouridine(55) synthase TruB [Planctomycetia bacterium]
MFDGFLNIHKPPGISSFTAVNIVLKEIFATTPPEKRIKLGHAGTLDPIAQGVLVVAIGKATKLISYVQNQKKTYRGTFLLGVESDSEDTETEQRPVPNAKIPTREEILAILPEFTGVISQRPPIYSALKVNGKKAYDLARKGKSVALAERSIYIKRLTLLEYAFPKLELEIVCGGGTYIRSLGRDLARRLGTGAIMTALTRTAVGVFHLDDALPLVLQDQTPPDRKPCLYYLRPLRDAVPQMPTLIYNEENRVRLCHGIPVPLPADREWKEHERIAVLDEQGELLAIVRVTQKGLRSEVHFASLPAASGTQDAH